MHGSAARTVHVTMRRHAGAFTSSRDSQFPHAALLAQAVPSVSLEPGSGRVGASSGVIGAGSASCSGA